MSKMTRKGLNATRCEQLSRDYGITYDSIIHEAIAILLWAIAEKEDGRRRFVRGSEANGNMVFLLPADSVIAARAPHGKAPRDPT